MEEQIHVLLDKIKSENGNEYNCGVFNLIDGVYTKVNSYRILERILFNKILDGINYYSINDIGGKIVELKLNVTLPKGNIIIHVNKNLV